MNHDNRGWDDDEETIVNFPRKLPVTAPGSSSDSVATEPFGPQQAAAAQAASEQRDSSAAAGTSSSPAYTGLETPPPSGLYGVEVPANHPAVSGASTVSSPGTSGRGQDPYLAAAGVPDSLPTDDESVLLPYLPPLPPSAPFPGAFHQARDHNGHDESSVSTFDIPYIGSGQMPGFGPPEDGSATPEPFPAGSGEALRSHVEPASRIISSIDPPNEVPEPESPMFDEGIDPPTIMDVPLAAQRELEAERSRWTQTAEGTQPDEAAEVTEQRESVTDPSDQKSNVPATAERVAADPAEVQDAIRERLEKDRLAGLDGQSVADQEWAALCEAVVATGGLPPVLRPPNVYPTEAPRSEAAEPTGTVAPVPDGSDRAGWAADGADQPVEDSPVISETFQPPIAPVSQVDSDPSSAHIVEEARAPEIRPESAMETTNLHLKARRVDAVAELAWLAILKSPTAHIHQIYRLDSLRMEVGRAFDAPIFVDDKTVSSRHAAIRYEKVNDRFEFVLYDLASTNGTYVNSTSVHMAVLKDDDRILVGETELVFKKVGDASGTE